MHGSCGSARRRATCLSTPSFSSGRIPRRGRDRLAGSLKCPAVVDARGACHPRRGRPLRSGARLHPLRPGRAPTGASSTWGGSFGRGAIRRHEMRAQRPAGRDRSEQLRRRSPPLSLRSRCLSPPRGLRWPERPSGGRGRRSAALLGGRGLARLGSRRLGARITLRPRRRDTRGRITLRPRRRDTRGRITLRPRRRDTRGRITPRSNGRPGRSGRGGASVRSPVSSSAPSSGCSSSSRARRSSSPSRRSQ